MKLVSHLKKLEKKKKDLKLQKKTKHCIKKFKKKKKSKNYNTTQILIHPDPKSICTS